MSSNSVFHINKGINRPIEFRGLKAQYIMYFVVGVLALLILFAILYIAGVNSYICVGVILALGTGLTVQLYAMSNKYGEHGLTKKMARRSIPKVVRNNSKSVFITGNKQAPDKPGLQRGKYRKELIGNQQL